MPPGPPVSAPKKTLAAVEITEVAIYRLLATIRKKNRVHSPAMKAFLAMMKRATRVCRQQYDVLSITQMKGLASSGMYAPLPAFHYRATIIPTIHHGIGHNRVLADIIYERQIRQ